MEVVILGDDSAEGSRRLATVPAGLKRSEGTEIQLAGQRLHRYVQIAQMSRGPEPMFEAP